MQSGIYKVTSPKGKVYIGQAVNIQARWSAYRKLQCEMQVKLYRSLAKYGWSTHKFEVVEECEACKLNERERYWQDHYDVLNRRVGLNCRLTRTDEKSGRMSDESRAKMSVSKMGEGNYNFGKVRTEVHCKRISENTRGSKHRCSVLVLNTETGIFYDCIREAAEAHNLNKVTLSDYISGRRTNKSNLIKVS